MNYNDLEELYNKYINKYGDKAYLHISELLEEAKNKHFEDWLKDHPNGDHEQSWRAFKGKNLEKLVEFIVKTQLNNLSLKVVNGNLLERNTNLSEELSRVKRNILVDFGVFGAHLPDADLVIYKPDSYEVIAIASIKVTLRERIAQSAYWKLKLKEDPITKNIRVLFITPDEDNTLMYNNSINVKKSKAIVETDLDCTYILSEEKIDKDNKIKPFGEFIEDLKNLI